MTYLYQETLPRLRWCTRVSRRSLASFTRQPHLSGPGYLEMSGGGTVGLEDSSRRLTLHPPDSVDRHDSMVSTDLTPDVGCPDSALTSPRGLDLHSYKSLPCDSRTHGPGPVPRPPSCGYDERTDGAWRVGRLQWPTRGQLSPRSVYPNPEPPRKTSIDPVDRSCQ